MTVYVREGVEVDKNRSNERSVTLTNLVQSTTGRYRCEVSTEGPTFATVSQFGDLLVVGKWNDIYISGTMFAMGSKGSMEPSVITVVEFLGVLGEIQ